MQRQAVGDDIYSPAMVSSTESQVKVAKQPLWHNSCACLPEDLRPSSLEWHSALLKETTARACSQVIPPHI